MANDSNAPATKDDLQQFMKHIQTALVDLETRMNQRMDQENEETRRYFDVIAENIHHDLADGALHDKIEQHEVRIQRVESHVGLASV